MTDKQVVDRLYALVREARKQGREDEVRYRITARGREAVYEMRQRDTPKQHNGDARSC